MYPLGMLWATVHEQLHTMRIAYLCLGDSWQKQVCIHCASNVHRALSRIFGSGSIYLIVQIFLLDRN